MTPSNSAPRPARSAFGPAVDDLEDRDGFDEELAAGIDPTAPLITPQDVLDRVRRLVQTAWVERWWLLLLDEEGRQLPVVPQLEMPPELGEAEADRLASLLVVITEQARAARLVVVWELPGARHGIEPPGPSMLAAALHRLRAPRPVQVLVGRGRRVTLAGP